MHGSFFRFPLSRLGFYQWSYQAYLNWSGKIPSERHILIRAVFGVIRILRHSLAKNVSHGSNIEDLQGDALIILLLSMFCLQ